MPRAARLTGRKNVVCSAVTTVFASPFTSTIRLLMLMRCWGYFSKIWSSLPKPPYCKRTSPIMSQRAFPIDVVRKQFPAINRNGSSIFFDNAAGAQIPQRVFDAVNQHLLTRNVQRGGPYRESQEVDSTIATARKTVANFVNAEDANEVAFGMNATSFIRIISLAIGQSLGDRREIIVTDFDHEANIATWLALERDGAVIRWWHAREDGALDLENLKPLLSSRTRLVACTANTNLYLSTRMLFSLARGHYAPTQLGRLSRNGVPHYALIASSMGMVVAIMLAIYVPKRAFLLMYGSAVAGMYFVWIVILLAHLRFGRFLGSEVNELPLRVKFFPVSSFLAIGALLALAGSTFYVDGLKYTVPIFLILLVAMSIAYGAARRQHTSDHMILEAAPSVANPEP